MSALMLCWAGCTAVGFEDEADLDEEYLTGAVTFRHPEVGSMGWDYQISPSDDLPICTGTLIARPGREALAPVAVLTAGHCIGALRDFMDDDGGPVIRLTDARGRVTRLPLDRRSMVDYRSACALPGTGPCAWADVGLVRIASGAGAPRAARIADAEPARGTPVTFLGYGSYGTRDYEDCSLSDDWDRKVKRFDQIEWGGSFYSGCPGDSGGPVMLGAVDDAGQPQVLLVHSGNNAIIAVMADHFGTPLSFRQQIESQLAAWGG